MKKDKKPLRTGWSEASKRLHAAGGDKLLIPDVFEDELIDVLDAEEHDFVNELNAGNYVLHTEDKTKQRYAELFKNYKTPAELEK